MANNLALAFNAFDSGRYSESLRLFLQVAEQDLPPSELVCVFNYIGYIYQMDIDIADYKKAIIWYKKSAELDDKYSQFMLGYILRCKFKNNKEALYWYQRAADKNYLPAIYQLGIAYYVGDIVNMDKRKGEIYLMKAAKSGHFFARAVIAKKSLLGHYGIIGIFRGIFNFLYIPISAFLVNRSNPSDERLIV